VCGVVCVIQTPMSTALSDVFKAAETGNITDLVAAHKAGTNMSLEDKVTWRVVMQRLVCLEHCILHSVRSLNQALLELASLPLYSRLRRARVSFCDSLIDVTCVVRPPAYCCSLDGRRCCMLHGEASLRPPSGSWSTVHSPTPWTRFALMSLSRCRCGRVCRCATSCV
jgi:hypothetical protein